MVGYWTCNQQVAGSNRSCPAVECNPGHVVNTHVPLSPSSIIWYLPMGSDALRSLASHWQHITDISGSSLTGPPTTAWSTLPLPCPKNNINYWQ